MEEHIKKYLNSNYIFTNTKIWKDSIYSKKDEGFVDETTNPSYSNILLDEMEVIFSLPSDVARHTISTWVYDTHEAADLTFYWEYCQYHRTVAFGQNSIAGGNENIAIGYQSTAIGDIVNANDLDSTQTLVRALGHSVAERDGTRLQLESAPEEEYEIWDSTKPSKFKTFLLKYIGK